MITYVFGSPGSGKSCYIQRLINLNRKYDSIYCNEKFNGAYVFDYADFGKYSFPPNSLIVIDEAGIYANNRAYASMSRDVIRYLKMHRHYNVDIVVVSQAYDDVDITYRRLASRYLYIKKLPFFTMIRPVNHRVIVDKESKQVIDGYEFSSVFDIRFFPRCLYYKYFNSYEVDTRKRIRATFNRDKDTQFQPKLKFSLFERFLKPRKAS